MNKKIRIMHIAQSAGGVDRYIKMLLKYIDKEKYENILVCSYDFEKNDYVGLVSNFEQLNMVRSINIADLIEIIKLRWLIKKYNPDIVYAHSSKAGALARIANIGLNNYSIYNPHGWAFNMRCSKKKQFIYSFIEKILAYFCNKIICISEAEKKSALRKNICRKNKLQVIVNGIDIEEYENNLFSSITRAELKIPENAFVIGMVGRISNQKAPDVFIKAAYDLKKQIPNAFFIIVGDGEMRNSIQKYADEKNISNSLIITGWVKNPLSYVEIFDVAMLLSRWEGFGLVLPEYMMVGKPIVASKVDAIPDIISDHENGILVNPENVPGTCGAVMELYKDSNLRNRLVKSGLNCVKNRFNEKRVVKEHEKLFDSFVTPNI